MGKKQPKQAKHTPQRTCIVCRQKFDKRQLTRIVRTPDSGIVIDPSGKRNGRGAYVCDQVVCWEKILAQPQRLQGALQAEISAEVVDAIATYKQTVVDSAEGSNRS